MHLNYIIMYTHNTCTQQEVSLVYETHMNVSTYTAAQKSIPYIRAYIRKTTMLGIHIPCAVQQYSLDTIV